MLYGSNLSLEQRKRLTIGVELAADPQVYPSLSLTSFSSVSRIYKILNFLSSFFFLLSSFLFFYYKAAVPR